MSNKVNEVFEVMQDGIREALAKTPLNRRFTKLYYAQLWKHGWALINRETQ